MLTLQAVGVGTGFYNGDSAVQPETQGEDPGTDVAHDDDAETDVDHNDAGCYNSDNDTMPLDEPTSSSSNNSGSNPVLFLYDCEATGGSIHKDHIIEVASLVIEPEDTSVSEKSFSALCRSSRHICKIG